MVKQLWLIAVGNQGEIVSEDPGVQFSDRGASGGVTEQMMFQMLVTVGDDDGAHKVFADFARGTLNYVLNLEGIGNDLGTV